MKSKLGLQLSQSQYLRFMCTATITGCPDLAESFGDHYTVIWSLVVFETLNTASQGHAATQQLLQNIHWNTRFTPRLLPDSVTADLEASGQGANQQHRRSVANTGSPSPAVVSA